MKIRLLYSVELDSLIPVRVITKHSNGTCIVNPIIPNGTIATLQLAVSSLELAFPDEARPKARFKYVDPIEAMKLNTTYWGTCVSVSPYEKETGPSWLGKGAKATLDLRDVSKSNPKPLGQ
jgi:hypothetical protein